MFAFFGWLGFLAVRKFLYRNYLSRLNPTEKLYREMLDLLKEKGYPKLPSQTPKEYCESLRDFFNIRAMGNSIFN